MKNCINFVRQLGRAYRVASHFPLNLLQFELQFGLNFMVILVWPKKFTEKIEKKLYSRSKSDLGSTPNPSCVMRSRLILPRNFSFIAAPPAPESGGEGFDGLLPVRCFTSATWRLGCPRRNQLNLKELTTPIPRGWLPRMIKGD